MLPHAFEMKLDRLTDQLLCLFQHPSGYTQSGEIRGISAPTITRFFMDDEILHFKSAGLRILFSVPGGTSLEGCPATVTVPGLEGRSNQTFWWLKSSKLESVQNIKAVTVDLACHVPRVNRKTDEPVLFRCGLSTSAS